VLFVVRWFLSRMETTVAGTPSRRRLPPERDLGEVLRYCLPSFAQSFPEATEWLKKQSENLPPAVVLGRDDLLSLSNAEIRERLRCK
jgi:hypothetical protein